MNSVEKLRPIVLGFLAAIVFSVVAVAQPPSARHFIAHLEGGQEFPVRETNATCQTIFTLSQDETQIEYRLIVANIDNVTAAHIHLGAAGANGPVVAFLAGDFPPGGGRAQGVLAEGTITAANLVVGSVGISRGEPAAAAREVANASAQRPERTSAADPT